MHGEAERCSREMHPFICPSCPNLIMPEITFGDDPSECSGRVCLLQCQPDEQGFGASGF
jgi:hypothetical protein